MKFYTSICELITQSQLMSCTFAHLIRKRQSKFYSFQENGVFWFTLNTPKMTIISYALKT